MLVIELYNVWNDRDGSYETMIWKPGFTANIIWKIEVIIKFLTSIIVKVQSFDESDQKLAEMWVFEAINIIVQLYFARN